MIWRKKSFFICFELCLQIGQFIADFEKIDGKKKNETKINRKYFNEVKGFLAHSIWKY